MVNNLVVAIVVEVIIGVLIPLRTHKIRITNILAVVVVVAAVEVTIYSSSLLKIQKNNPWKTILTVYNLAGAVEVTIHCPSFLTTVQKKNP